jgi:hypothetical protein
MSDLDPNAIDWPRVYAEAVAIALTFGRGSALEIVQEGVKRYLEGQAPWAPGGESTLVEHLVVVGRKARGNQNRSERRRYPKMVGRLVAMFGGSSPSPSKKKRLPDEAWDALEDPRLEEEVARITALSDAELDRELARHGLDPKAIRARGAAIGKSLATAREEPLEGGAWVSAPPTPIRAFDRRWVLLLAAALALVGVGGSAIALGVFNRHDLPTSGPPDAAPSVTVLPPPAPLPEWHERSPLSDDKPRR